MMSTSTSLRLFQGNLSSMFAQTSPDVHTQSLPRNLVLYLEEGHLHPHHHLGSQLKVTLVSSQSLAYFSPLAWGPQRTDCKYEFFSSFNIWPSEVRSDLRAGIKAKHQGDLALSERFLRRALDTALSLPVNTFSPEPYLKISGIAISLAEVLESNNRPKEAYEVYENILSRLQKALVFGQELQSQRLHSGVRVSSDTENEDVVKEGEEEELMLTGPERLRAISIASKLGEMAETYQQPLEEEEKWLTWAVEELLRTLRDSQRHPHLPSPDNQEHRKSNEEKEEQEVKLVLSDLDLPHWVRKTDIGAPIEALGAFYAKSGKLEYAMPLYLQAVSLLIPPPGSHHVASPEDTCRAAQLMNNLSELIMRGKPTPQALHQAEAWAQQALGTIRKTESKARDPGQLAVCEQALGAVLFNLASFSEMRDDREKARELFTASWEQSKHVKSQEGILEARAALRRLDRLDRTASKNGSQAGEIKPSS
ncbi:hypothetical protein JAAARDRAFT_176397 [Jaapia argillacea MUCL 33604]|uniref:Uncharacterized protein n=1 Tax=Jaapia argillacea MUCL 33604 TaxID=933084 RepID=A0A067Q795_9AGAM|nr:hypothetical protein JAAARDRAFT_176397 [Jaapia argillacea MUCL 33604]